MLVLGLTGGIAAGKLTVSAQLAQQFRIIDADVIAKEVVQPGTPAYKAIVGEFGDVQHLLHEDGTLNRPVLGRAVFGTDRIKSLNRIVHGAVKKEIARQVFAGYFSGEGVVVLDVPLLFESGLNYICGVTVTVSIERGLQKKRLLERNPELSEEDAEKRILSQLSMAERERRADYVISNNGTLEDLRALVARVSSAVQPGKAWTLVNLFPPFGLLNAVFTVVYRALKFRAKAKQENETKKAD